MSYDHGYRAILDGDADRLRALLARDPDLARVAGDREDWPSSTLLEHAVWWGRREMVDALVSAGAAPDRPGGQPPETPLQRALELGADRIADLLGPASDLGTAAGLGDAEGVRSRLAAAGEDPEERRRAFRWACLGGRRATAALLCPEGWFDTGALVEALIGHRHLLTWDQGETAWDWAAAQLELADPLNLFDENATDGQGRSVADAARGGGHGELAALIEGRVPTESRRVPPERVWRPCSSPEEAAFLFACQWGQTSRVREHLRRDPGLVRARTLWDMGCLYLPGAYGSEGSLETALVLFEAGARPYDGIGGPCWWGATQMVLELLRRGAPAEVRAKREGGLLNACAATRFNLSLIHISEPTRPY